MNKLIIALFLIFVAFGNLTVNAEDSSYYMPGFLVWGYDINLNDYVLHDNQENYTQMPYYSNASNESASVVIIRGSDTISENTTDAVMILEKYSGNSTNISTICNPTLAVGAWKQDGATGTFDQVTGIYTEAISEVDGGLVEGIKSVGSLYANNSSANGGIFTVYSGNQYRYMIGVESEIFNSYQNATTSFDKDQFSASFVATNEDVNRSDAAYVINPYSFSPFVYGLYIGKGSVSDVGIGNEADLAVGIDWTVGGSVGVTMYNDNNAEISWENSSGVITNCINLDSGDTLTIGADSTQISSIAMPLLAGTGNDYICVDQWGILFRSNTAC